MPVPGSPPGCPQAASALAPALLFWRGEGKKRARQLPLQALPTALAHVSDEQEQAGSGPKHHPWTGPCPDLLSSQSSLSCPSLLFHSQGVRIPSLGSFDVVPTQTQVGNEVVIIQRPVFHLARNLAVVHNLVDDKDNLLGKMAD